MGSDEEWLQTIRNFAVLIRDWEQALADVSAVAAETGVHPYEPEPGSVMAVDTKEMGFYFPAVSNALVQSVDHLAATLDLIQARPELRVFAYPSLTRSALLGSAEAVWLMCPEDRRIRTARAYLLSAEELKNHAAFAADYPEDPDGTAADYRKRYQAELVQLDRMGMKDRYQATNVIRVAAQYVEQHLSLPQGSARWTVSQWRMMSAQAHGRTWDKRYRQGYVKGEYRGEHRLSANVGTVATFGEWLASAVGMTAIAWELFDDGRREGPNKTH